MAGLQFLCPNPMEIEAGKTVRERLRFDDSEMMKTQENGMRHRY